MRIPDIVEQGEARAEAAADEFYLGDGKWKCPNCWEPFDPNEEGGPVSADPYALPVCGACLDMWAELP